MTGRDFTLDAHNTGGIIGNGQYWWNWYGSSPRLDGDGRPSDLELLLDVCDNISPGIAWPPRQTTICPLGPSAVSPIASALERFRPEFEAYIANGRHARAVRVDVLSGAGVAAGG